MSSEYEEFMSSEKNKRKSSKTIKQGLAKDDISEKLNLILKKLEAIEENLGITSKTIYDDMKPTYSIKETAAILGCTSQKVRKYVEYNMLDSIKVGHKVMVESESIKKLVNDNKN
ncbi:helix-turn-helix domain-containing protein [Gammaproteobacteria bacterium]|nr:helix-turn-helix domain-containing protein [Gammaproteobacteria bacterium]